jgi:hypothetical protein
MNRVTRKCIRTALVLATFACLLAAAARNSAQQNGAGLSPGVTTGSASAGLPGQNINDVLNAGLTDDTDATVEIAPMTKKGSSADPETGSFTKVDRKKIFDGIFSRAEIDPCTSDPVNLKGHKGYLEYISKSSVLNPGGTRTTFGYFIKVTFQPSGRSIEYFALFSYDKIKIADGEGKETVICATEFFVFGGITRKDGVIQQNPPELEYGLAINPQGTLLKEVPKELAQVSNFGGMDEHKGETVKPGVEEPEEGKAGTGCLTCHARRDDDEPESTIPFPWVADPKAKQPAPPPKTAEVPKTATGGGGSATGEPKTTTPPTEKTPAPAPKNGQSSMPAPSSSTASSASGSSEIRGVILPKTAEHGEISGRGVPDPEHYANIPGLEVIPVPAPTNASSAQDEVIDLGDGRQQPADGPVTTEVSVLSRTVPVSVYDTGEPHQPIAQGTLPVENFTTPQGEAPPTPADCTMPPVAQPGSVQVIHVAGDRSSGDSTEMSVTVDDAPAEIVSAKPGYVYWNVPEATTPGLHHVKFIAYRGAAPIELPMYAATLEMSADETSMTRGQSTEMHVTIDGLEEMPAAFWRAAAPPSDLVDVASIEQRAKGFHPPKSTEPGTVLLLIENHSPAQIKMGKSGERVVLQLHQSDFAKGPYTYQDKLQSVNSGGFDISGTMVSYVGDVGGSD